MTLIIVETKVTIADEFGNKVTEILSTQRSSEGNSRFFASEAAGLNRRCMDSICMMIQTEYGKVPEN
jgi:hypothetical protein